MKESQRLIESIDRLNGNIERLNSRLESLAKNSTTALDEIYLEAEALRDAKSKNTARIRNKVRIKSEIEIQGAIPFVVKRLMENMTYERIAEAAQKEGYQFSHQSVSRFYRSIAISKVEGGKIYVVLKSGDTYVIDADTFEVISTTGKI